MNICRKENIKELAARLILKEKGGIIRYFGRSMFPILKDGYQIKVKPVNAEQIQIGDIAVFESKRLVIHRLVGKFKKDNKFFLFHKGDNSPHLSFFPDEYLLGKAEKIIFPDSEECLFKKVPNWVTYYLGVSWVVYITLARLKTFISKKKNLSRFFWKLVFLFPL